MPAYEGAELRPQGGYFCRADHLAEVHLPTLAREALTREGLSPQGVCLLVTRARGGSVVRLAFDPPASEDGARWYESHHALAQLLSSGKSLAVHAYTVVPSEFEEVVAYADGRRVGGERVRYEEVEPTDEELEDDALFARLQDRWPVGRLAQVLGLTRRKLLSLSRRGELTRVPL